MSFLWIQAGLTLLILLVINVLAGMATRAVNHFHKAPRLEQAYNNAPWAVTYFKILRKHQVRWFPYSYWKSVPVSSQYMNVDARGDRETWNSPHSKGRPPFRIFMFGGSTMWGTGVRDDATLASIVARRLTDAGQEVEVTNYGQIGYVSTQEVMLLFQLLREGRRPDLVVFYDGINDAYAAYQNRIAGLSQNEYTRVQEFNLLSSARRTKLYLTAAQSILMHSNIARLGRLFDLKPDSESETGPRGVAYLAQSDGFEEPAVLQQQVITLYLFNKRAVEALGREFGFRSVFYWQPVTYTKNELAPYEQSQLGDVGRRDFMMGVYRLMAGVPKAQGVRDLSDIFRNHKELIFIDTWHPNEAGNQIIAQRMADDIAHDIDQITHDRKEAESNKAAAVTSSVDSRASRRQPEPAKGLGARPGALE